jgi:hypothetical protein
MQIFLFKTTEDTLLGGGTRNDEIILHRFLNYNT